MFNQIVMLDYQRPLKVRAAARKSVGPYSWRPARPMTGRGFYQASRGLECDPRGSSFALRLEDANEHLPSSRLRQINGYFCDPDGDGDTLRPIIARLPRARGFLAGWTMGEGMAAALGAEIYADPEDAARAAHAMADRDAEDSRDNQEQVATWPDESDGPEDRCTSPRGHSWVYSGTAYGGDDERWGGEGRCYCEHCGADGDA